MFEIDNGYTTMDKLKILADAAKYDVACTSSGVDRKGKKGALGNSAACGICHSFAADGRCISLLKVLMTNHCVFDCKYCVNRRSNDVERVAFEPDELCRLVIEFYKRNYIEGLFLSSGVLKSPEYTMEKMCEVLNLLRNKYMFNGYIHVKTIPGAPDELLSVAGYLADRISINLELPTKESLKKLAPNKKFENILEPMGKVTDTIAAHRLAIGKNAKMERGKINSYLERGIFSDSQYISENTSSYRSNNSVYRSNASEYSSNNSGYCSNTSEYSGNASEYNSNADNGIIDIGSDNIDIGRSSSASKILLPQEIGKTNLKRAFAPAGQSTQMIIGATPETDLTLVKTTEQLYKTYDLKRVFYSAYIPVNEDSALPDKMTEVPLLREHRLYQADWLMRFYGFRADELLTKERPNFNEQVDPKCDWALRHLDIYPVEVQRASYDDLLRVPGIGPKSAMRIVNTRRYARLDFDTLKKIGVVLKRAHYFITCNGKMMYNTPIEENYITRQLVDDNRKDNWKTKHQNDSYSQMSLFDDFNMN